MSARLNWFVVPDSEQFLVGEPLKITRVGEGYVRAVSYARDFLERPHARVNADLLTAECNEVAELFIKLAAEDGTALSLGHALRALVIEAARTALDSGEGDR